MTAYNFDSFAEFIEEVATRDGKPCRRFGVEIETPEACKITPWGFDTTHDPSVADADCECECDECAHSCDCPYCERSDYGSDHCGSCTDNELALEYHQGTETTGNGYIRRVCEQLQEIGSNHEDHYRSHPYGGHIHTEARDLSTQQLATLLRAYKHAQKLFPTIEFFGREENDYCSRITESNIEDTAKGWSIDRMVAVNTQNVLNFKNAQQNNPDRYNMETVYKSTVEFRQFASTNDWKLTLTRVAFCIALVDYIAKGTPVYWLLRTKTWQEFAREIQA